MRADKASDAVVRMNARERRRAQPTPWSSYRVVPAAVTAVKSINKAPKEDQTMDAFDEIQVPPKENAVGVIGTPLNCLGYDWQVRGILAE